MRLVITGGSGLLGNKLVRLAGQAGHEVQATYNTHPVEGANAQYLDLTNETMVNRVIRESQADAVIHAACITDVDFCEQDPDSATRVNGTATGIIADACRKSRSFLVYVSTDYVFDGQRGHYKEEDVPSPINEYGRSKLLGEIQVQEHAADFCIARTSVVYGWGREHRPNFATWVYQRLRKGERLDVVADQHVSPTLNSHLARMLLEVAERRIRGFLHVAGATRLSRYEFAARLARAFKFDERLLNAVKSESINWRARRPFDSSLNVGKALEILNNKPVVADRALEEFATEAPTP